MCYVFVFITTTSLLLIPSTIFAQNPKGFLTFENCTIKFFYPKEWKDYLTDYFECKENDQAMNGITEITFPQPSLSEKITPKVTITVEPCCLYASPPDEEGIYHANWKNMTLDAQWKFLLVKIYFVVPQETNLVDD
jgi:hypothetical protein